MATLFSSVGGPKIGANLNKIMIIREIEDSNGQIIHRIDFNNFLKSGDRSNFIKIKPNDTIIIPQKFSSMLLDSASGINTILGLFILYIQISSLL